MPFPSGPVFCLQRSTAVHALRGLLVPIVGNWIDAQRCGRSGEPGCTARYLTPTAMSQACRNFSTCSRI